MSQRTMCALLAGNPHSGPGTPHGPSTQHSRVWSPKKKHLERAKLFVRLSCEIDLKPVVGVGWGGVFLSLPSFWIQASKYSTCKNKYWMLPVWDGGSAGARLVSQPRALICCSLHPVVAVFAGHHLCYCPGSFFQLSICLASQVRCVGFWNLVVSLRLCQANMWLCYDLWAEREVCRRSFQPTCNEGGRGWVVVLYPGKGGKF